MASYKVKSGQTLFDISLQLYGTVEGLFDLLISNPDLSMTSELQAGVVLEYHPEFAINTAIVEKFNNDGITVANGERHVYHKDISEDLVAIIKVPDSLDLVEFSVAGEGDMYIDWGDNSPIEKTLLTHDQTLLSHYFDNSTDKRRICVYGEFALQCLDLTLLKGDLYLTKELTVDEFICQSNDNNLAGLFLFDGTYKVNLEYSLISDLAPIYDMSLSELRLTGARFQEPKILNDYLVYISENYGMRRACKVYIDEKPSDDGVKAIEKILNEPQWNEPEQWEFYIGGKLYTIEDGENIN